MFAPRLFVVKLNGWLLVHVFCAVCSSKVSCMTVVYVLVLYRSSVLWVCSRCSFYDSLFSRMLLSQCCMIMA